MLKLPNKFKNRIINRYGQEGRKWLNSIDTIINTYTHQFELENIKLIENLSMNIVILAKSHPYGDIVMKIGKPGKTSIAEINIMKRYSSKFVPKCYYFSISDRVMILEQIVPGYALNQLKSQEERFKIFSDLANHLLISTDSKEIFPTFEKSFYENINYVYQNESLFRNMLEMIAIANTLYDKIKKKNLPKYILHDDLHHKNILKSKNGWKAIDPHGVIGEKVFETCQFIRAELEYVDFEENKIDEIVSLLSYFFKEDKKLILEALYIYIIQKIIFYRKNGYDIDTISYNIDVCKKILNIL